MKTIALLLIGYCFGWFSYSLIQTVHDRKTAAWDKKYKELQDEVESSSVTIDNFNQLTEHFLELWHMPGFNKEKYQVLKDKFLNKFCNIK